MQKKDLSKRLFNPLFSLLLIGLPFSKALVSAAFVGLILLSIFTFFQKKTTFKIADNPILILPFFIFLTLLLSLFYSTDLQKGFKILTSQIEFLALPFIFIIQQQLIKNRFVPFLQLFINSTTLAALITFLFFLLPNDITQKIAETIPLLKDYIVHEKTLAFGVYSPFTERLQFSYVICVAIFVQLWLLFKNIKETDSPNKISRQVLNSPRYLKSSRLIILILTLLILGARGAQIGFLVGSMVWLISYFLKYLHPLLINKTNALISFSLLIISLLLFLVVLPFLTYKNIPAVKVRYDQMQWELATFENGTFKDFDYQHFTSIRRLLSWKNSWAIIQKQPILGVGIGDYQQVMEMEYAKDTLGFPVNTQSQFLYFWTVSGLLGLFSFLLLLIYPIWNLFSSKNYWRKVLVSSFILFYSLVFVFDAPLNFQVGGMTFLIFYSLLSLIDQEMN